MLLLLCLSLLIIAVFIPKEAGAFSLTPELKKEIAEKKIAVEAAEKKATDEKKTADPFVYFDLAMTYAYSNKIEEGWALLKKVHEQDKQYAPKMIKKYVPLIKADPSNWKNRIRLAFSLFFDNQKEKAIEELQGIETMDPKNIWALAYQALIYGEEEKIDKGILLTKKALKIDNDVSSLHYLLGTAYIKKGWQLKGYTEIAEALRLKALGH